MIAVLSRGTNGNNNSNYTSYSYNAVSSVKILLSHTLLSMLHFDVAYIKSFLFPNSPPLCISQTLAQMVVSSPITWPDCSPGANSMMQGLLQRQPPIRQFFVDTIKVVVGIGMGENRYKVQSCACACACAPSSPLRTTPSGWNLFVMATEGTVGHTRTALPWTGGR